jgi:hypothetical protein
MSLRLAALLFLVPVCVFVPGFVTLRRFTLSDTLRLSVSVAVSLTILFGVSFVLYLSNARDAAYLMVAVAVLLAAIFARRDLLAFLRTPAVSAILLNHAIFVVWLLLLSLFIRNFSGGGWAGDWREHFERAVFFCDGLPLDTQFLGLWTLTARPPFANVVAAFFMRITGTDFASYQLTAVLLGSLEYLGAASLWSALTREEDGNRYAGLLALTALLCLNPSVAQNATYPWTRALTNFFLLQAAALFLLAVRGGSHPLRRWSYLLLGLALVTHYSTVPYLIALALVEFWYLVTRRLAVKEAALAIFIVLAAAVPWLAFALDHFGIAGTFLTNSTVAWNAGLGKTELLVRGLGNLFATLVPHVLRDVRPLWVQDYGPSAARDFAFLIYQVSLPALMGSVGWLAITWMLARGAFRRVQAGDVEPPLMAGVFLATVILLGTMSVALDDQYGVAHVCLQPLGAAGLVFLAARWKEPPGWLKVCLWIGLLTDAALGIGLHSWMQHLTFEDLLALRPVRQPVTGFFIDSLAAKMNLGQPFLGDMPWRYPAMGVATVALVLLVALALKRSSAESRRTGEAGGVSVPS